MLYKTMQWNPLLCLIWNLDFLIFFCISKLMCPGLFHAILWHQCTRLTAAAILCHALMFPLWRLQVPLSDTVLIAFSWSWCICEPPVCTRELTSSSDIMASFHFQSHSCSSVNMWVCKPGRGFSNSVTSSWEWRKARRKYVCSRGWWYKQPLWG